MRRSTYIVPVAVLGCALALLAILPVPAAAFKGPGTTGASYLTLQLGARSPAMGEVKAALASDPFTWLSNPALLQAMNGSGVGISHAEWILDTRYDNVTFHRRLSATFVAAGGVIYQYRPDIQGFDEFGAETKLLKNSNYQAAAGIAFSPFERFGTGVTVKYFSETFDEWKAGGVAADVGVFYSFESPRISIGCAAQNLGADVKFESVEEPLPTVLRAGASHSFTIIPKMYECTYAFDVVKPRFEEVYLSVGGEIVLHEMLAVRAGYCGQEYRQGNGFTMGGGVRVLERLQIDYAWTPYGDLGDFHHISLHFAIN